MVKKVDNMPTHCFFPSPNVIIHRGGNNNAKYLLTAIICLVLSYRLSHELAHLILVIIRKVGSISSHFSGQEMRPKEIKLAQVHTES